MPLFSVIVPVYKVEAYLPECIDSILSQTHTDFELILVDDGSPDNCGKICDEYAAQDSRIRVIHKENGGVTSARQMGAELSTGSYIACIDGDDWVDNDYLKTFAEIIRNFHPDIVCCGYFEAYADRTVSVQCKLHSGIYDRKKMEKHIFPQLIYGLEYQNFPLVLWAKTIKRELFLVHHSALDPRIKIGEDGAVCRACLGNSNSLYIISDSLYYYRQNICSVMKTTKVFDMNMPRMIATYLEKQINMEPFNMQEQLYTRVVRDLFYDASTQFNRKEKFSVIVRDIKKTLDDPYYVNAAEKCNFKGNWKEIITKISLKYKICSLMFLWNRVRKYGN